MDDLASYNRPVDRRPVDDVDGGARLRAVTSKTCRLGNHPVTEEDFSGFSYLGKREFSISGCCEPCFDRAFAEPPLWSLVCELLDNAIESDYRHVCCLPPLKVAEEMVQESAEVENCRPEDLVPHILAWQEAYWL